MEASIEKCFHFSGFIDNLIDKVIPVKMVVISHT